MTFKIDTKVYKGPFDVLLALLRKHEVDIHDIPISKITRDFLHYISTMKKKDLELSGEFILVAATLMDIKARMLLPVSEDEGEDPEDPRQELVERIIEYQYYQQAVEKFMELEKERSYVFSRMGQEREEEIEPYLEETSVYELLKAWQEVAGKVGGMKVVEISRPEFTLARRVEEIAALLEELGRVGFSRLFPPGSTRSELIISLLALLELAHRGRISIYQDKLFGEISIGPATARPTAARDEVAAQEETQRPRKGRSVSRVGAQQPVRRSGATADAAPRKDVKLKRTGSERRKPKKSAPSAAGKKK